MALGRYHNRSSRLHSPGKNCTIFVIGAWSGLTSAQSFCIATVFGGIFLPAASSGGGDAVLDSLYIVTYRSLVSKYIICHIYYIVRSIFLQLRTLSNFRTISAILHYMSRSITMYAPVDLHLLQCESQLVRRSTDFSLLFFHFPRFPVYSGISNGNWVAGGRYLR